MVRFDGDDRPEDLNERVLEAAYSTWSARITAQRLFLLWLVQWRFGRALGGGQRAGVTASFVAAAVSVYFGCLAGNVKAAAGLFVSPRRLSEGRPSSFTVRTCYLTLACTSCLSACSERRQMTRWVC